MNGSRTRVRAQRWHKRSRLATECLLTAGLLLSTVPNAGAQARDPHLQWETIRTKHFEVHYHRPLEHLARKVAKVAESANERLLPFLQHKPRHRTHIVVSDHTDGANGFARVLPYNVINVFATAPDDLSPLNDFDDWMRVLVVHEHTHILHLDNIGGIPALLNAILGKVYSPNTLQPRWFIEGYAVLQESKHTSAGRLRSTIFDMFMRMDALQGRLLRLDQISHQVDRWPHGNAWYLYGSKLVQFVEQRYGSEALAKISESYGSRLIPYGLSRMAKRATGKTWPELYEEFLEHTRKRYERQLRSVERLGIREGRQLTTHGEFTRSPRFIDRRKVAYWTSDGRSFAEIRDVDTTGVSRPHSVVRANAPGALAVTSGGTKIVFSGTDAFRDIYLFADLFSYDRKEHRTKRLTTGKRAREPDVSADNRQVAFVINSAGTSHLAIADLEAIERTEKIVVRSKRYDQVYTPRFSPDGNKIAYSVWLNGGYRDIHVVDLRTREVEVITRDRAIDTGPTWSPSGHYLYYSSDRSGIANIYARNMHTGNEHQVTNVMGGAFQPVISPDAKQLVYLGYTTMGYDLFAMSLERPDVPLPIVQHQSIERLDVQSEPDISSSDSEPYNPLPTLLPQAYQLEVSENGFGTSLAVVTDGEDVVGFNRYQARVEVGLEEPNLNASLAWRYQRSILPITFSAFTERSPRRDLFVEGMTREWVQIARGASASLSYPIPRAFDSETLQLSYQVTHLSKAGRFGGVLDPNDPPPTVPVLGWFPRLSLQWNYTDAVRTRYDVSKSFGREAFLSTSLEHPSVGSRFRSVSLRWGLTQYFENPWVEHHVLALNLQGGIGGGEVSQRPLFGLGGFQNQALLQALFDGSLLGGTALRGYAQNTFVGTQFHLAQAEYRFLIYRPQFGADTLPFFVNRIWANVFTDVGTAFFGQFRLTDLRAGSGAELFIDFTTEYVASLTLRLGLARGFAEDGSTQGYANLGVPF